MIISTPRTLSLCKNRSILAKTNPQSGGPEDWFTENNLQQLGMQSFSFDFFVNWEKNKIANCLWFKRFIDIDTDILTSTDNWEQMLEKHLIEHEGLLQLKNIFTFGKEQKLRIDFLLFNEHNWNENKEIIYARLISEDSFKIKAVSLDELKNKIRVGTGQPFKIRKGLTYSTSKLECNLSITETPYPGDADILIKNKEDNGFKLIEFKKHNLKTPISEEKLSNYYPHKDASKYNRLNLLKKFLSNTQLYTVYYTTDSRFETKIELNAYSDSGLMEGPSILLDSPKDKSDINYIYKYLSNCVEFFNSN
ncbi:hypothetical protein [Photobacterium leiognathi]|uniref:hypothetical protein n=1 Tax=Photobacterium leiognathi TaxID=553611 RepID=UPI00273853C9|nr:hypothetical protein [Photobacterium leiognathi]